MDTGTPTLLRNVHFAQDDQTGIVVGLGGLVLLTGDGGETWTPQDSGSLMRLVSVHLSADGRQAWAVGSAGTVLESKDGGRTWLDRTAEFDTANLKSVRFAADGLRGWIAGERRWFGGSDGVVFATLDGGVIWYEQETGSPHRIYDLQILDDGRAVFAGGFGGVLLKAE
jgi:photosystem II stability/assembly factor-like uncharacterized protein